MPIRTTQDYNPPVICPQIKAIVNDVIKSDIECSHINVKLPVHSVGRNSSKLDQEGKYKQATKVVVDMHNYKYVVLWIYDVSFNEILCLQKPSNAEVRKIGFPLGDLY